MEQEDFVKQAAEPIQAPQEPEYVVEEEAQTQEPVATVEPTPEPTAEWEQKFKSLESQMTQVSNENESLKYQNQQALMVQPQAAQTQVPVPPNEPPRMPDQYSENYAVEMETYMSYRDKKVTENVSKEFQGRMDSIELLQGQQAWEAGITECKKVFGNDFDINKEGRELQNIMQTRNINMLEAKKIKEFDTVQEKMQQLQSGQAERLNTQMPVSGSTQINEPSGNVVKVNLTEREKAYCRANGKDMNNFGKWKHIYETSEGNLPI